MRNPSVLGGYRPVVNDTQQMNFRAIQYLRAQVEAKEKDLAWLKERLKEAESMRNEARKECGVCGNCSACVG
jgi:hypothetical protein